MRHSSCESRVFCGSKNVYYSLFRKICPKYTFCTIWTLDAAAALPLRIFKSKRVSKYSTHFRINLVTVVVCRSMMAAPTPAVTTAATMVFIVKKSFLARFLLLQGQARRRPQYSLLFFCMVFQKLLRALPKTAPSPTTS